MTEQESKYPCNNCREILCHVNCAELNSWIELAEESVKKKVPVNPYYGTEKTLRCGACGAVVKYRGYNVKFCYRYCDHCGQAIDWSDSQ